MKKMQLCIWTVAALLAAAVGQASVIDAPHNETTGIRCASCHSYSLWWKYSPTTQHADPEHTTIADTVCLTCHGGAGPGPKALTHSSAVLGSTRHGTWGVGCMACHDPHYQDQLRWVGSATEPYLITGTISAATYSDTLDQTTLAYTGATSNPNWPAFVADPTAPDWANKSLTNPDRGLILVHDKTAKANTFLIISATESQVVVKGKLDSTAIDPSYVDPRTARQNSATCNTFGLIYGGLIRDTINAKPVKFFDPNGGFVAAGAETTGICQVCHATTERFTADGVMPAESDTRHANYATSNCTSCHRHQEGFKPQAHDNTSFAWTGNCATCHDRNQTVVSIVDEIHGGCRSCHATPAGGGERVDGDPANGVDGSAIGAGNNATCVDCHLMKLGLTGGEIHHVSQHNYAATGACSECHADTPGKLAANHAMLIQEGTGCSGCHPMTAGTAAGAPVDPADAKVHDACTTCHATSGALKGVAEADDPATKAAVTGMAAGPCEGCHGAVSHTDMPHDTRVSGAAECNACHTGTAGTASGMPVDPADGKVHDACTTCHSASGSLKSVAEANDPATKAAVIAMAPGTCIDCHGAVDHSDMPHDTRVTNAPAECVGCHTGTAGTAAGMPVNATDDTVHDACTTCHHSTTGTLKTAAEANDPTTPATVVDMKAGACSACHDSSFASHSHSHDVHYDASVDQSQAAALPGTPCASCHDDAGANLGSWAAILMEHGNACATCHSYTDADGLHSPPRADTESAIAGGSNVTCVTCHTEKAVGGPQATHGSGHGAGWRTKEQHGYQVNLTGLATCQNCHGADLVSCTSCHTSNGFANWASNCTFCHGERASGRPSPPLDIQGRSDTAKTSVGRHDRHVGSTLSSTITCVDCHLSHADVITDTNNHIDGNGVAEVVLGGSGVYTRSSATSATCATSYCHGNFQGGTPTTPNWTSTTAMTCTSCHLTTTQSTGAHTIHAQYYPCSVCHGTGYSATSVNAATHVNGVKNVGGAGSNITTWISSSQTCTPACHGSKAWGGAADTTKPTDGTLTLNAGDGHVDLAWTPAIDEGGLWPNNTYLVRFLSGGTAPTCFSGTSVYMGTAETFTHSGLTNGSQYSYRVCAFDARGNYSDGITGTVTAGAGTDTTPPTHTGTLTATAVSSSQINLSWPAATDAGSGMHATTPYTVVKAAGATAPPDCSGASLYTGTATSYSDTGLTAGTQYSYRVCATDAGNNASPGLTASGTTLTPE